jgi:beta-galactosidase
MSFQYNDTKPMKRLSILLSICLLPSLCHAAESRTRININPVWRFHLGDLPAPPVQPALDDKAWETVSLPHTHQVLPADLSGFTKTGRQVGWYRRILSMPDSWKRKKVFLEFQGAMQTTKLWLNGTAVGEYTTSGYDSFHFDITATLKPGPNELAVCVDNSVNPDIPPDGQKTDFIQFGGLYRDVHVVVTDPLHITFPWEDTQAGIRLTLPEVSDSKAVVLAETQVRNASDTSQSCTLLTEVRDRDGKLVTSISETQTIEAGATHHFAQTTKPIPNPNLWSPEDPYLYQVHSVVQQDGKELDRVKTRLGIRWVEWTRDRGFFLNGKHLKLVGANRHQTWPFIGNAVPNGLHRRDAEQLKEMGCNWVRCSHYPHDPDFLDYLDELGIMALEEGPTWMKTGGRQWMDNLEQSFRRMIRRDRNHASLIIWNACVNHSGGNKMLIAAAKVEDPTRARGQDNVPCPMNFRHKTISGNGALCIEHTGHTFDTERGAIGKPGKAAVGWVYGQATDNREYELTRRHWEHTDAAYKVPGNSGLAVWCMYDYNTFHNATAAIARHGVLDLFRIPKHSWWWHQSELTEVPMAYIIRINETEACVVSNGEEVRLLQHTGTGQPTSETRKPDTGFSLRHPPFHFKVSPQATALKAEALKGGKVVASHVWKKPGPPAKLTLQADRASITADGADISRIIVSAVDANGTETPACTADISFSLEGNGQLIGENPVQLRAGKMIILAQSSFSPGKITIRASAKGLAPASTELLTTAPPPGIDMPSELPAKQPSSTRLIVKGGQTIEVAKQALAFEAKQNVEADQWIESDPIMLDVSAPLAINGGEYRIYTSNWTDKPGKAGGGDAVFVRVKSSARPNGTTTATLTVGNQKVPFTATTRP